MWTFETCNTEERIEKLHVQCNLLQGRKQSEVKATEERTIKTQILEVSRGRGADKGYKGIQRGKKRNKSKQSHRSQGMNEINNRHESVASDHVDKPT